VTGLYMKSYETVIVYRNETRMNHLNRREQLLSVLYQVWSNDSSSKWTPENPANGQCGVTGWSSMIYLVEKSSRRKLQVAGIFITELMDSALISPNLFSDPIEYMDMASSREEAFSDTNVEQYNYLRQNVFKYF